MSQLLVGTTRPPVPRVNLLPRTILERRRLRRLQAGLVAGVAAALVLALAGWLLAGVSVHRAQGQLAQAQARTAALNRQVARYAAVPRTEAALAAARTQLATAMGGEVRWSARLDDLALMLPDRVWLTSMSVQPAAGAAAATGTTGTSASGTTGTTASVATVTIAGVAYSHDDVAAWLDALAGVHNAEGRPIYSNVFLTSDHTVSIGARTAIAFESSASVTLAALSNRYTGGSPGGAS